MGVDGKYLNQSEAIIRFIGRKTGAYPTEDPFACHFADSVINTFTDFEQRSPKQDNGKPLMYKMFGPDKISDEDVTKMVDARKGLYDAMTKLLGDKTFFVATNLRLPIFGCVPASIRGNATRKAKNRKP